MNNTTDEPGRGAGHDLDRLAVTGIEAFGHHGVLDAERRDGQVFLADLVLWLDTREAARSDDLRDTVDYGSLVDKAKQAIESDPVDLVEKLAQRLADICLEDPRVHRAEVTLHKPGAPIEATFTDVTLTIARTRTSTGADRD
jgi:7,8-dihydroneopterin aldolase/epimerase/oxygenase